MNTANNTRSPVVSIAIARREGNIAEIASDGNHTVAEYAHANSILRRWARSAPKGGAYDKCDVTVTWANGETYRTRYDLKREGPCDTARHVATELAFYAGECPAHMNRETHAMILATQRPDVLARIANLYVTCDLGAR